LTIVDTNILFDLTTRDSQWASWSLKAVETAAADGPLLINAVIYAELSTRYETLRDVDDFIDKAGIQLLDIPRKAAFLAAKAFVHYRASGGIRTGVLSDFFIGAHAAILNVAVLTRDSRRYRTYLPDVRLITPNLN